jgi:hypothetical protein
MKIFLAIISALFFISAGNINIDEPKVSAKEKLFRFFGQIVIGGTAMYFALGL